MIKAYVTFTKEIAVTVIGESIEEIRKAAEQEDLRNWDTGDWDVWLSEIKPNKIWSEAQIERMKCHCGVLEGELVAISDYNAEKETEVPEADV